MIIQFNGVSWKVDRKPSIFVSRNNPRHSFDDCVISVETRDVSRTGGFFDASTGKWMTLRRIMDAHTGDILRDYPGPALPTELSAPLLRELGMLEQSHSTLN